MVEPQEQLRRKRGSRAFFIMAIVVAAVLGGSRAKAEPVLVCAPAPSPEPVVWTF